MDEAQSCGTNNLIKEGASIVLSPLDIIEDLEYDGIIAEDNKKINPEFKDTYNCIGTIPITVDEISRITQKDVSTINEELLMLEMDGFIEDKGLGRYIKK